jgi:hypothetical protein
MLSVNTNVRRVTIKKVVLVCVVFVVGIFQKMPFFVMVMKKIFLRAEFELLFHTATSQRNVNISVNSGTLLKAILVFLSREYISVQGQFP